jgi:hypothetical protein
MRRPNITRAVEIAVILFSVILGTWLGLFGVEQMQKEKQRKAAPTTEQPR